MTNYRVSAVLLLSALGEIFMSKFRNFILFLLPVLAAGYLTMGCNDSGSSGGSGDSGGGAEGKTILCVGDSITRGLGVSTPYPSILAGITGAGNVVNAGVDGVTASYGAGAINGLLSRHNPDIVCIMYGANDARKGIGADSTVGNIAAIVDAVKAFGARPIVGQVTPQTGQNASGAPGVKAINGRLGNVGAPVAGTFGAVGDKLQPDGLHPNDLGMSGIAGAFADKI
jgi:lysophospholipase L1-like esterase